MPAPSRFPVIRGADGQQSRLQDSIQQTLEPVVTALRNTPIMGAAPPALIRPTLLNGFSNPTADFEFVGYRINCLREVRVQGRASHVAGTGVQTVVFVLPAGYRPRATRSFAVSGGATFNAALVFANGEVQNRLAIAAGGSIYLEFTFQAGD